jgi:hypothetical protein
MQHGERREEYSVKVTPYFCALCAAFIFAPFAVIVFSS